ncbi:MAG: autotransporter domain-containing protein [Rhizobiales bacterium]|nr:autotransporter domain-containing protein [Hyphomicrobiales bacterium]
MCKINKVLIVTLSSAIRRKGAPALSGAGAKSNGGDGPRLSRLASGAAMAYQRTPAARQKARLTNLFFNCRSVLPLAALGLTLAFGAPTAWADEVIDNATESVIGTGGGTQASPWNIGDRLFVGTSNTGRLDISAGGEVSNTDGIVGSASSGDGTVTVTGAGSTWTNSNELYVGNFGTGELTIADDGTVEVNGPGGYAFVAKNSGSTGTLNIGAAEGDTAAAAGKLDADRLVFGGGSGTLNFNHTEDSYAFGADISGGGIINQLSGVTTLTGDSSGFTGTTYANGGTLIITGTLGGSGGIIGSSAGTTGAVSVQGAGASWTTTTFRVGDQGTGSLTIAGGGTVGSGDAWIGNASGAIGTASVTGTGSSLTASNGVDIGRFGTGTLNILDGATVTAGNDSFIGDRVGSDGTMNVSDDGSSFDTGSSDLFVGNEGTGALNVTNGGEVSTVASYIGDDSGSSGEVTVTGSGSRFTNSDVLAVGYEGNGTLNIADGGSVSNTYGFIGDATTSTGAVTVDGTGSTWTNANNVSVGYYGTAALTIANGGTVSAGSGSGTVTLGILSGSTGTLNIGAAAGDTATGAGTLDAGAVTFGDGTGVLNFNHTDTDYEFAAAISGAGAINHLAGVTTLTGVSVGYGGVTTITGGTLQIDGTLGGVLSGAQRVENGAFVIKNGGVAVNLTEDSTVGTDNGDVGAATVTGVGSSWVNSHDLFVGDFGTGTLTITDGAAVSNDNAFVGKDAVATGTVNVAGSTWSNNSFLYIGFEGAATLNVESGGSVDSESSVIGYQSGSSGTVTVTGAGSSLTSQTMLVGDRGNGALTVADGGEASIEYGYVGGETGTGAVTVTGAGSSLTSSNELVVGDFTTGTLTIAEGGVVQSSAGIVEVGKELGGDGTLNIGAAAGETAVGAGTLDAEMVQFGFGAGTINFNHTDTDYEFAVDISRSYGSGTINQIAGITKLTADASAFNGITDISGGSLYVNTTLGGTVNVTGGTLGGSGTLGSVTIGSGGTLTPGNSIGTVTVSGDLLFNSGSNYNVEVSPSDADRTDVTGTATLAGSVNATYEAGSYTAKQYTILNAVGGLSGTFDTLANSSLPSNISAALGYDANNVYLDLTLSYTPPGGLNTNQQNVGDALTDYFNTNGGLSTLFTDLSANGLSQTDGEVGAGVQQMGFDSADLFMNSVFDKALSQAPGRNVQVASADAAASFSQASEAETGWGSWAAAYGGTASVDDDNATGSHDTTSHVYGLAAGADYRLSADSHLGFALGGASSRFSLAEGFGSGEADIFNAALYGRQAFEAGYLAAALGYSWQDATTERTVTSSGIDVLQASFHPQALSARLEAGHRFETGFFGVTPYAGMQSTTFFMPSYREQAISGSSQFALAYDARQVTAMRSELGARFDERIAFADKVLTLKPKLAWAHDWNRDRRATASFQQLAGTSFTVNGAEPAADSLLVSAGAELALSDGWALAADFDSEFSGTTTSYAGKGSIRWAW